MNLLRRAWRAIVSEAGEPAPDDLVLLGTTDGELNAEMWRGILESQGIPSIILRSHWRAITGPSSLGLHRVQVRYGDLQRAREALGLEDGV
jgi:hypothetical protein